MCRTFYTLIFILLCLDANANSKNLILGFIQDYPPYSYELNDQPKGRHVEQIIAISTASGVAVDIEFYPVQQLLRKAVNGDIDGIVGLVYRDDRAEFLDYVLATKIDEVTVSLYTLKQKRNIDELINKKAILAAKIGFALNDDLHAKLNAKGVELYRFSDISIVLKLMEAERIDDIIHSDNAITLENQYKNILFKSEEVLTSEPTYLTFSKTLNPVKVKLASKLSSALLDSKK